MHIIIYREFNISSLVWGSPNYFPGSNSGRRNAHLCCITNHDPITYLKDNMDTVVMLPQNIASSAKSLPRPPQDLDVIIVRKESSSQSHCDFHVWSVVSA